MLEAVMILAATAKKLTWEMAETTEKIVEVADITLGPKEGLPVVFLKRTLEEN